MFHRFAAFVAVGILLGPPDLSAAGPPAAKPVPPPVQVPSEKALAAARANVETVFRSEIKQAVTPAARGGLARKMLKTATDEKDPSLRYALFQAAREVASDAGDAQLGYEITESIVAGFVFADSGTRSGKQWIAEGDELRQKAKVSTDKKERLKTRLEAAECYLRAEPGATGLAKELIAKKIGELNLDGLGRRNSDLAVLIGAWNVTVWSEKGSTQSVWTFARDGTVVISDKVAAKWVAEPNCVRVIWNEKAWETFQRPLNEYGVKGDSWKGPGRVQAKKVTDAH